MITFKLYKKKGLTSTLLYLQKISKPVTICVLAFAAIAFSWDIGVLQNEKDIFVKKGVVM